jgi:energy-coupling factor transporter ATP-binding protein EcfA2
MENKSILPQGTITSAALRADCSNVAPINANLQRLLDISEKLRSSKSQTIVFEKPLIYFGDNGVIFPNSINVVQGQNGSHKSRFAQLLSSLFLSKSGNEIGGFCQKSNEKYTLAYVDTERNMTGQFPYALQMIQKQAGIPIEKDLENFVYTSFITTPREERINTLKAYILYLRATYNAPLFVVLDIATDFINDFNNSQQSMEFSDFLNEMINTNNMTFLCIIHENPNSFGKARGHLGTELINKASTVFQIYLEKTDNDTPSDIINVKYLKNRSTKRLPSIYFRCNEETQLLELADENDVKAKSKKTTRKADESEVISYLEQLTWQSAFSKNDLCNHLKAQFNVSDETLINRLKVIEQEKYTILNENSETCHLFSFTKGKEKYFEIRLSESIA